MRDNIDRTAIGAIGGIIGGLGMMIFFWIVGIFLPPPHVTVMNIAHLFIPPGQDHTFWGSIIGYIAHFALASLLGIAFINIFRITGRDWATTKGIIFGAAMWIILHGMIGNLLKLPQQTNISVAFALLVGHFIFGMITSWSILGLSSKARL